MKRVLFLLSHLQSGSDTLYTSLDRHPRIQGFKGESGSGNVYENLYSLVNLTSQDHKLDNASAIYMDELLFNNSITAKTIYPECNYIFLMRDPRDALNEIVTTRNYSHSNALNYYLFRLRRMYSIAKCATNSILLTFSDLESGRGSDLITDYLKLKEPLQIDEVKSMKLDNGFDSASLEEARDAFEKWLFKLKELGLRTPSA